MDDDELNLIARMISSSKRGDVFEARGYADTLDINNVPKEIVTLIAFIYIDTGDAEKAVEILGNYNDYDTKRLRKQYCYAMATAYEHLSKLEDAHKWYMEGLKINVKMPEFTFDFANFMESVGNIKGAKVLYEMTLQARPSYYWARVNYANILSILGKERRAIRQNKIALRIDKLGRIANYNIGVSYAKLGKLEKAIKYYQNEIKLEEGYPLAYFNLGVTYKDLKKYDYAKYYYLQGIEKLKQSYEENEELASIYFNLWYNLVCLYIVMSDYNNASECLNYLYNLNKDAVKELTKDPEAMEFIESEEFKRLNLNLEEEEENEN